MTELLSYFQAAPLWLQLGSALALGLLVGSFLNVVMLRMPQRMEFGWRREAASILENELKPDFDLGNEPKGIVWEPSHCPSCKNKLKPWHNIPLVSYLMLLGRCSFCGVSISVQYPAVELLTGLLSMLVILTFGWSAQGFAALGFTWILIAAAGIDAKTQYLPDELTLSLLWLGLLASLIPLFVSPRDAVIGAALGYLSLWSVYQGYKLIRGVEGMGFGDFKLLAALGAWMGWQKILLIILLSAVVGTVIAVVRMLVQKLEPDQAFPFGPFLAAAGWVALLYGDGLIEGYARASGLR